MKNSKKCRKINKNKKIIIQYFLIIKLQFLLYFLR